MKNHILAAKILKYMNEISESGIHFSDLRQGFETSLIYAFSVDAKINGKSYVGYGQAKDKDKASFVALMELVERFIVDTCEIESFYGKGLLGIKRYINFSSNKEDEYSFLSRKMNSTNGVSIHKSKKLAVLGAKSELIERHVILRALVDNIIPTKVSNSCKHLSLGEKVDTFAWQGPLFNKVVISRCIKNNRTVYGFGCAPKLNEAIEKSLFEIFPRICLLKKYSNSDEPLVIPNQNFLYHWYEDTDWTNSFFSSAAEGSSIPYIDCDVKDSDFLIGKFKLAGTAFEKLGIFAYVARSKKMQPLFSGDWDLNKLNVDIFNSVASLPPDMHMIG